MVRITIDCEDYWVADSLHTLGTHIENSDILDEVYNGDGTTTYDDAHFTCVIENTSGRNEVTKHGVELLAEVYNNLTDSKKDMFLRLTGNN